MFQQVILMGFTGKDAELRYSQSGKAIAKFTIATTVSFFDKNTAEKKSISEWHNVTCFDKVAENAQKYVKKGMGLHIVGTIKSNLYEKDGHKFRWTEIIAKSIQFLPKSKIEGSVDKPINPPSSPNNEADEGPPVDFPEEYSDSGGFEGGTSNTQDDDIPF